MTSWVADYSSARPGGAALVAAGAVGVVRYAGALTSTFNITADEVADLHAHNLPIGIFVEQKISTVLGGRAAGRALAEAAAVSTRAAGLPDGLSYLAADDDFTLDGPPVSPQAVSNMVHIADTGAGFKEVAGTVGLYADFYVIDWMVKNRPGLFAAFVQPEAWSHGNYHPEAALIQRTRPPQTIPAGCDYNTVVSDWHPRTSTPTPGGHMQAVTGDLINLHPTILARLQAMADGERTDIHVNSGHRSHEKQIELWNAYQHYLTYGTPWAALAARPGQSLHEGNAPAFALGLAADISIPGYEYARTRLGGPVAAKYGLVDAIPSEGWHFQGVEGRNLPDSPQQPTPTEDDVAIPLPQIDLADEKGHPSSVALFSYLAQRINSTVDVSTPAARSATCKHLQAFFKVAGGADGVCGQKTWAALLFLSTGGGK